MRVYLFLCMFFLSVPMVVGQQVSAESSPLCDAKFEMFPDSLDPMTVRFQDLSTGQITYRQWSFGDGTTSTVMNPVHTYTQPGSYFVCLTIATSDSVVCHDELCLPVTLPWLVNCEASFTFLLDSLNPKPRFYQFTSTSPGYPDRFRWNFGDGSPMAETPVVNHQFPGPGAFKVCLSVFKNDGLTTLCHDSVCQWVTPPRYFNLGGHLFAGQHPINNPVSSGDTGVAYLYRKTSGTLIPVDTIPFTYLGYYAFPELLSGEFLVKGALTPDSKNFQKFFPAWYPNALTWVESAQISLADSHHFATNISMSPIGLMMSGDAYIRGSVVTGEPAVSNEPVPDVTVLLYDSQMVPLQFTTTGDDGSYGFSGLPFGAFYLYADNPGRFSRYTAVWLDQAKPMADPVVLGLFNHDVTGVHPADDGSGRVRVSPNPAGEVLNLHFPSPMKGRLQISVYDIRGYRVFSEEMDLLDEQSVVLPLNNLKAGLYLLGLRMPDHQQLFLKMIKR
jgi:hypothetical protein